MAYEERSCDLEYEEGGITGNCFPGPAKTKEISFFWRRLIISIDEKGRSTVDLPVYISHGFSTIQENPPSGSLSWATAQPPKHTIREIIRTNSQKRISMALQFYHKDPCHNLEGRGQAFLFLLTPPTECLHRSSSFGPRCDIGYQPCQQLAQNLSRFEPRLHTTNWAYPWCSLTQHPTPWEDFHQY